MEALSAVTQLGIHVAVSFLLWIFAAQWVRRTFGLGNYVSVFGVILGAGSGALSFWKFCTKTARRASHNAPDGGEAAHKDDDSRG